MDVTELSNLLNNRLIYMTLFWISVVFILFFISCRWTL